MLNQLRKSILPPRMIMKVSAVNADGTVTVTSLGNTFSIRALGTGSVGSSVYVQDGVVIGSAPTLPHATIEV